MKERSATQLTLIIVGLLLIAGAMVINVQIILNETVEKLSKIFAFITSLAMMASFVYLLRGARKSDAMCYKIFLALTAVSELTIVAASAADGMLLNAANAVCLCLVFALLVGKNLGMIKSILFCDVLLVLRIVYTVYTALNFLKMGEIGGLRAIGEAVLALIICICTGSKYLDKVARGRTV